MKMTEEEKEAYEAYLDRISMPSKPRKLTPEEIEQLKNIINNFKDYEYAGCCEKGENALKQISESRPDILIVDEVIAGTDIPEVVDLLVKNKNLKNHNLLNHFQR